MTKTLYTTRATANKGGRGGGESYTEDGTLRVTITPPGKGDPGTNPEQLFGLGYSACYLGALHFVAGQAKEKLPEGSTVTAEINLTDREDQQGFWISAKLEINLPGMDPEKADDLIAKAHVVCPYSEVSRNGFTVELKRV